METGKSIRGAASLAFDAVEQVTNIVEGMYRNISATPMPFGEEPKGSAPGIAGLVHEAIRLINLGARTATDKVLEPLSNFIDESYPPGPHRAAAIAALNGVCGDHLASTENTLAIPMRLRVFLDKPDITPFTENDQDAEEIKPIPFAKLFETKRRAVEIYPNRAALRDGDFKASGHILLLLHGLCMNDMEWTSEQHNHGHMLAEEYGYTPVFALYNSGRHVSENGEQFAAQVEGLVQAWPVPVESISIIGFSMGGLVTRSAMHYAQQQNSNWLTKVTKAAYVGTPHHGSALERGGYWLQKSLSASPYTAPLSALGKVRSNGITDLRHGNIQKDDWQNHDEHADNADHRLPTPLPKHIEHFAIGATLSKAPKDKFDELLSDGLVHPSSSKGSHPNPNFDLDISKENYWLCYNLGHLAMLHDQGVAVQLSEWFALNN